MRLKREEISISWKDREGYDSLAATSGGRSHRYVKNSRRAQNAAASGAVRVQIQVKY